VVAAGWVRGGRRRSCALTEAVGGPRWVSWGRQLAVPDTAGGGEQVAGLTEAGERARAAGLMTQPADDVQRASGGGRLWR
jgi:hypothetical protein